MALIDVVQCTEQGNDWIVWKFLSQDLRLGTQLIVNETQKAMLVKNGQVFDIFNAGRHTLSTSNIPFLNKVINLPFGGNTPFTAEVWFFNTLTKRDQKWGTPNPINITDFGSGMSIDVRSFGSWGYQLVNPTAFYHKFVGATVNFSASDLKKQFDHMLLQKFTGGLAKFVEERQLSVTRLMAYLDEISAVSLNGMATEFALYGIEVTNFNIGSLTFDQAGLERIRSVEAEVMRANKLSQANIGAGYQVIRNLDILESAANNPNSAASVGMSTGIGLGAGLNMAQMMGSVMQSPPVQSGQMTSSTVLTPEERLLKLKKLFDAGLIEESEYKAKRLDILSEL